MDSTAGQVKNSGIDYIDYSDHSGKDESTRFMLIAGGKACRECLGSLTLLDRRDSIECLNH